MLLVWMACPSRHYTPYTHYSHDTHYPRYTLYTHYTHYTRYTRYTRYSLHPLLSLWSANSFGMKTTKSDPRKMLKLAFCAGRLWLPG